MMLQLCGFSRLWVLEHLRIYTRAFGENLLKAFQEWRKMPAMDRADVRTRRAVDLGKSDKEIFDSLPTGDLWLDARVHEDVPVSLRVEELHVALIVMWTYSWHAKWSHIVGFLGQLCCAPFDLRIPDSWGWCHGELQRRGSSESTWPFIYGLTICNCLLLQASVSICSEACGDECLRSELQHLEHACS